MILDERDMIMSMGTRHSPGFHQRHGTPEGETIGFQNDWIHVTGKGVDLLLVKYGIPPESSDPYR